VKLSYYGYFTPFSGYGIANLNWVKYLRRLKVNVSVNAKFTPRPGSHEWEILNDEERDMFKAPFEKQRIGIIETTPNYFYLNDCEIKIANTMCETDLLGEEWVTECNKMDYVIVPNMFYYRVFMESGVTTKLLIIPHGVDGKRFSYLDRSKRVRDDYIFGCCGYLNTRKGVFELIQAFHSEFNSDEKVKLRLHTTDPELGYYKNLADPRIEITNELWDFDKLVDFYHDLDAFVFPSKAEGIGYPPREAMATGLPTIVMDYSGLEDIADWGFPLRPIGYSYEHPMREQVGRWAKIDIPGLMGLMRYLFENKLIAQAVGKRSSYLINEFCSWETSSRILKNFLYGL